MKPHDVVQLVKTQQEVTKGSTGTIVEALGSDTYLVEFCDPNGRTEAMLAVHKTNLNVIWVDPSERYGTPLVQLIVPPKGTPVVPNESIADAVTRRLAELRKEAAEQVANEEP